MRKHNFSFKILNYIFKKTHNLFYRLLSLIIFIVDIFFKKKKNLIVFSQKNRLFSDNSKALFIYILKHHKEFEVVWLVDTKKDKQKIYKSYKYKNIKVLWSINGLKTYLNARIVIISNSLHDVFPFCKTPNNKEVIQLWHGINWSKKFEYPNNNFTKDVTIACASSLENKKKMSKMNRFPLSKIYVTGLPRNDILFNKKKIVVPWKINKYLNNKIILYAPTHKESIVSDFFPFKDKNLSNFNVFLKKKKIILFLRPHINDSNKINNEKGNNFFPYKFSNIKKLSFNEMQDINEFLPFINILVTDYSTIYADALLINIPTIFIPYDLKDYIKKRGLIYKYDEVAIGDKVYNQSQFINSINKILKNKIRHDAKIKRFKKKFHQYLDGNSSKRVMKIIKTKYESY